jgi:hypothetical protein
MTEDSFRCSVAELVSIFHEALLALVPTAERLLLEWRDEYQHRDWERVAASLFDVCIRGPIEADSRRRDDEYPLASYDIDVPSYATSSWITIGPTEDGFHTALIRLMSDTRPFDRVQIAKVDPATLAPVERLLVLVDDAEFAYFRRSATEPDSLVSKIEAVD